MRITFEKISSITTGSTAMGADFILSLQQENFKLIVTQEWQAMYGALPGDLISVYHYPDGHKRAACLYRPVKQRYQPVKALTIEHHNIPLLVRFRAWLIKVGRTVYYGVKKHSEQKKENNGG